MRRLLAIALGLAAALLAVGAGAGIAVLVTRTYRFAGYPAIVTCVSAAGSWWLSRMARTQWSRVGPVSPKLFDALILLALAAASAIGVRHILGKLRQQRREIAYQSALHSYSDVLKPGMTRKEVEDYLRTRNIGFRQMCCVEPTDFSKGVYDDLTKVGQEEAPWFCSQKNVYVAFHFTGPQRASPTPTANPADVLRAVTVYRWLEGCL